MKNCLQCNKKHSNKKFCSNHCKNIFLWNTKEYKEHQKQAHKGNIPTNLQQLIAYSKTKERRKAVSDRFKGQPSSKGMLYKKHSEATKRKMSIAKIKSGFCPPVMRGENNPNWIKDRTKLVVNELDKFNSKYKNWMLSVKKRDNWECRIADVKCNGRLEAHHILSYTNFPELRYKINNGITLCHAHHPRKRIDEAKLSSYFQQLVAEMN